MTVTSDYTQINACDDKSQWTGINFSPDDNTSGSPVWAAYEPATARVAVGRPIHRATSP